MILNTLFKDYLTELKQQVSLLSDKYNVKPISYALTGSVLRTSHTIILGNNWGGSSDMPPQTEMPLVNDMLAYPKNPTYHGYLTFLSSILDDDFEMLIDYIQSIVYSNGCFIRTPNEGTDNKQLLIDGYELSKPILKKMIDMSDVDNIICFGNGEYSATRVVGEILLNTDDFWKEYDGFKSQLASGFYTYKFSGIIDYKPITVYSFPHAGKLNIWELELMDNEVYKELKGKIQSL